MITVLALALGALAHAPQTVDAPAGTESSATVPSTTVPSASVPSTSGPSEIGHTETASTADAIALEAADWTTLGASLPGLELPAVDGSGPVDLGSLVREEPAPGAPPTRTLLVHFASWDAASRRLVLEWVDAAEDAVRAGRLRLVCVAQEQSPDRPALFAALHGLDFPLLWDPFALCGLERVPLALLVDEDGRIRAVGADPRAFADGLGPRLVDPVELPPLPAAAAPPRGFRVTRSAMDRTDGTRRALARLLLGGAFTDASGGPTLDADVSELRRAAEDAAPEARFRYGVALRMRAATPRARADDFQRALDAWRAALAARPERLVWRRRIQRFGPLLDRPDSFYGWARPAVHAGARLVVPLGEGESAPRTTRIPGGRPKVESPGLAPDAADRPRDPGRAVRIETAVALNTGALGSKVRIPAGAARVHVTLRPRPGARWADRGPGGFEPAPPELMLEVPDGWQVDARRVRFRRAGAGAEPLRIEFEVSTVPFVPVAPEEGGDAREGGDADPSGGPPPAAPDGCFRAFALYRAAAPGDAVPASMRQDFDFRVEPAPRASAVSGPPVDETRRDESPADLAPGDESPGDGRSADPPADDARSAENGDR
ncbi:MAG: hypothetical protein AAFP86_02430 [Planctomycetota bacterium]